MKKKYLFFAFLAFIAIQGVFTQDDMILNPQDDAGESYSRFSIRLYPGISYVIGADSDLFTIGGTAHLAAHYHLRRFEAATLFGALEYTFQPLSADTGSVVSVFSLGGGVGYGVPVAPWMRVHGEISGGYYLGFLTPSFAIQGAFDFGTALGFLLQLSPALTLGIRAGYNWRISLNHSLSAGVYGSLHLGELQEAKKRGQLPGYLELEGRAIEYETQSLTEVFPVFYTYYDDHPIGTAAIKNVNGSSVSDLSITVYVKQFMDAPKPCEVPSELSPNESTPVEIRALFAERILDVTEGTKVPIEVTAKYRIDETWYHQTWIETLRIHFRNAMTWDDDRKASAFITARDPVIQNFAKNVTNSTKPKSVSAVDQNFELALAIHEALRLYGISYQIDARTPYATLHQDKLAVDSLQFPRETLSYRSGDCDDLSILYASLLEALAVPTAFVTVPGHIYIAFRLSAGEEEAKKSFSRSEELIVRDDGVWVPIEVTERDEGFLKAWQVGAKEWREYDPSGQAGFYPTSESWTLYEPVALPGAAAPISLPGTDSIVSAFEEELDRHISRELLPQIEGLQNQIEGANNKIKLQNKLGVLYARYGMAEEAHSLFDEILEREEYLPAIMNKGNIYFAANDLDLAYDYYERAYRLKPDSTSVLLSFARVNHELENYGTVKRLYEKIKEKNPELAEHHKYLEQKIDDSTRAGTTVEIRKALIWEEE